MDKNKAIEKIKKCLALGKSANEHEAAQALKQAQALMREYGISDADVALSDIKKHACTAKTANQIPGWQAWLANTVKAAFGAEWYLGGDWNNAHIVFYGAGNKAELAAYAYSVLLRQLESARRDYIATRPYSWPKTKPIEPISFVRAGLPPSITRWINLPTASASRRCWTNLANRWGCAKANRAKPHRAATPKRRRI